MVRERKQCHQLRGVLGQAPVAQLAMSEEILDDVKRMLDLGADARGQALAMIEQRIDGLGFVERAPKIPKVIGQ